MSLGTGDATKTDEFSEKVPKRGVILNPNIFIADFGPLKRAFFGRFLCDSFIKSFFIIDYESRIVIIEFAK